MTKGTIAWRIEKRNVQDLVPADYNPRKMTEQERRDLEDSIREFGAVVPIVVNVGKRANVLVGGHQRTTIYADLGIREVDVMVPSRELTPAEEKRLNLRLNKNTGGWDFEKLKDMDLTLLLDVGFGDEELATLWDDVDVIDDDFDMASAMKEVQIPKTKPGDVWILGHHRLMCGDPMSKKDVHALMEGGELVDLINCDAPRKEFEKAVVETIANVLEVAKPNAHAFYWADENQIWVVQETYLRSGMRPKRICAWVAQSNEAPKPKEAFVRGFEPCVYGVRGKPYLNAGMAKASGILNKEINSGNQVREEVAEAVTLWLDKRDAAGEYQAQKPVTIAEKPLKRCTAPGNVVLDLYAKSGSMLIACQQLNRKARLMEPDPVMCDVIVNRWEVFTNKKAKKK